MKSSIWLILRNILFLAGLAAIPLGCGSGSGQGDAGSSGYPDGAILGVTTELEPAGRATWDEMMELDRQMAEEGVRDDTYPPEGGGGEEQVTPPNVGGETQDGETETEDTSDASKIAPNAGSDAPLVVNAPGFASIAGATGPPDTMGAAGPNHLMTTLNNGVQVQTKGGTVVQGPMTLEAFFAALPNNMFDPRVIYSRIHGRWFVTANFDGQSATSGVGFAVSDTDDPTGGWTFYAFDVPGVLNWADFVSMGLNKNWIVLTTDILPIAAGAFVGEQMWIIEASSALAGGALTVTTLNAPCDAGTPTSAGGRRIKPAVTHDPTEETLYCASTVYNPVATGDDGTQYIRLSQITQSPGGPVWSPVPTLPFPFNLFPGSGLFLAPTNYSGGDSLFAAAPQMGGGTNIDTGRVLLSSEPQYRNNRLWITHTGGLPAGGAETRTAIFWYQLDPRRLADLAFLGNPVVQTGVIDGGGGAGPWYYYPSLAVNAQDDMCLGMSRSSATLFVEAVVTGRDGTDPLNTLDPIIVTQAGLANYFNLDGNGRNRWGDYSATCVDPVDDLTLWSIQEFASATNTGDTWWTRHSVTAPLSMTSSLTYPIAPAGNMVTLLDCSDPPVPPSVNAECTTSTGAPMTITFSATAPSGSEFDVELYIDDVLTDTRTAPQAVPGPSAVNAPPFAFTLPVGGPYVVEVRADDGAGDIDICQIMVTVADTQAPVLGACPVVAPVECTSPAGAVVTFTAPTAVDACDPTPTVVCQSGGGLTSGSTFPIGTTTVTCTATDAAGLTDTCMFDVVVQDTTPPMLTFATNRSLIWSPRSGLIDVLFSASATDVCDPAPQLSIAVHANEGVAADVSYSLATPTTVALRGERDNAANGRIYLVVVRASDNAVPPNTTERCLSVVVPGVFTSGAISTLFSQGAAGGAACEVADGAPPAGYSNLLPFTDFP